MRTHFFCKFKGMTHAPVKPQYEKTDTENDTRDVNMFECKIGGEHDKAI
jgi:hypothetical protein